METTNQAGNQGKNKREKFQDPLKTATGEQRALVSFHGLKTLWFNTGTLCNLQCTNCYIESSPENDRLVYLTTEDVLPYLKEITRRQLPTKELGFTGGEPFANPHFLRILELCLDRGHQILILTNAYRVINPTKREHLRELNHRFPGQLTLRISLDHYSKKIHEEERGKGTFDPTLKAMKELQDMGIKVALAARTLGEKQDPEETKQQYHLLLSLWGITLNLDNPKDFILFPEMDLQKDVPEITSACWNILGKSPKDIMCSSSRMVVKRKKAPRASVVACTLLPYDTPFELGQTLKEAEQDIPLNHPYCAQFCVLGGSSCS